MLATSPTPVKEPLGEAALTRSSFPPQRVSFGTLDFTVGHSVNNPGNIGPLSSRRAQRGGLNPTLGLPRAFQLQAPMDSAVGGGPRMNSLDGEADHLSSVAYTCFLA